MELNIFGKSFEHKVYFEDFLRRFKYDITVCVWSHFRDTFGDYWIVFMVTHSTPLKEKDEVEGDATIGEIKKVTWTHYYPDNIYL
jgi:hypothetical protein